jgi:hypothetical protein
VRLLVFTEDGRTIAIITEKHTDLRDMQEKFRYEVVEYKGTGVGVSTSRYGFESEEEALRDGFGRVLQKIL